MVKKPKAIVKVPDANGNLTDYSDRLEEIEVDDAASEFITTFEFTLSNGDAALNHLEANDEVEIYWSDDDGRTKEHIVTGIIDAPRGDGSESGILKNIEGGDFGRLLQDRDLADAYINENIKDIVLDMMSKEVPEITTNNVQDPGVTLDRFIVPGISVFEALKKLLKQLPSEWQFYVDVNKDLHFEPKGDVASGETLEEGVNISTWDVGEDRDSIVNFAQVYGKSQSTREKKTVSASGSEETIKVDHKPKATRVENTTDGAVLSGGITGVDKLSDSDVDYLVDFHNREITINEDNGDTVEIEYDKGNTVFAFSRDVGSINDPNIGEKKKQFMVEDIETEGTAQKLADRVVDKYAFPLTRGEVEIDGIVGLKAGQTVTVKIPSEGLNETLTIARVTYELTDSGFTQTVEVNERLRSVDEYIKDLEQRLKSVEARMSGRLEVTTKLFFPSETVEVSDSGKIEKRDLGASFVLNRNVVGDHHEYATADRTATEKGFNDGTTSGNATVDGNNDVVTLASDNSSGTWTDTLPYNPVGGSVNSWGVLTYTVNEPANTSVTVNILDGAGNTLATDVSSGTDLSTISGTKGEDLQVEVNLNSTSTAGNVPELVDLRVDITGAKLGDQSGTWTQHDTF